MTLELLLIIIASAGSVYGLYLSIYLQILVAKHKKDLKRRLPVVSGSLVTSDVHHRDDETNNVKGEIMI